MGHQEETPLLTVVDSYSSMDIKGGDDHGGNTSWAEAFAQYLLANSKDYMEELQEVKVLLKVFPRQSGRLGKGT